MFRAALAARAESIGSGLRTFELARECWIPLVAHPTLGEALEVVGAQDKLSLAVSTGESGTLWVLRVEGEIGLIESERASRLVHGQSPTDHDILEEQEWVLACLRLVAAVVETMRAFRAQPCVGIEQLPASKSLGESSGRDHLYVRSDISRHLGEDRLNRALEDRQVRHDDRPYLIKVDAEVVVREDVPHSDRLRPIHLRMPAPESL